MTTVAGGYCWVSAPGVTVDLDAFETLAAHLRDKNELTVDVRLAFRQALDVYTGDLLGGINLSPWMNTRREEVCCTYIALIEKYIALLENAGDKLEIISVCRTVLDAQPLNEALRLRLSRALAEASKNSEALLQYEQAVRLSFAASAEERSKLIHRHYEQILAREATLTDSLSELHAELLGDQESTGALICDNDFFHEVYQLQRRCLERTGADILLGILVIGGLDEQPLQLERALTTLFAVLRDSLRRGDAATRLHVAQVAVLIPLASDASGHLIMDRIRRNFYQRCANSNCQLTYRFMLVHTSTSAAKAKARRT